MNYQFKEMYRPPSSSLIEMTMGIEFPLEMGFPRKLDKHRVSCGNGKKPVWKWEQPLFPWEIVPTNDCSRSFAVEAAHQSDSTNILLFLPSTMQK